MRYNLESIQEVVAQMALLYITFDDNRQACYVWWNDSKREANLNWLSNFDNSNDWFVFRNLLHFSPVI